MKFLKNRYGEERGQTYKPMERHAITKSVEEAYLDNEKSMEVFYKGLLKTEEK